MPAGGEDEILDAEEIALDQQEFFVLPCLPSQIETFPFPVPLGAELFADVGLVVVLVGMVTLQRHGQGRRGLGMVIERNVGAHSAANARRRRGDRMGKGQPQAVEVV